MILLDVSTFIGRLHPLVVHLPIAFLLLAALFQWVGAYKKEFNKLKFAIPFILGLGAVSAIASCLLGWLLSKTGDYNLNLLENHKYSGIALAVVSSLLFFFSIEKGKQFWEIPDRLLSILYIGIVGLVSYSGHQGGNLTHGTEYLSLSVLTETKREPPTSLETVLVYEDLIEPILDKKCVQCHQSGKKKGELLMTSYEALLKGGKHGEIIIAGNTEESEILRRVNLDPEDEEFMPTDGKTPLTQNEKEILTWWIKNGAPAKDTPFLDQAYHKEALSPVEVYLGFKEGAVDVHNGDVVYNTDIPTNGDVSKITAIESAGFQVRIMNYEPLMLDVSIDYGLTDKSQIDLKALEILAPHIIWLNVSESEIDDNALSYISQLKNLEKLRLEGNNISNEGIKNLGKLTHLNALNLNETKVSKEVLKKLKDLPALRNVYLWKTSVVEADIEGIKKSMPEVEVVL